MSMYHTTSRLLLLVSFAQLSAAELSVRHQDELLCKISDIKQWDPAAWIL